MDTCFKMIAKMLWSSFPNIFLCQWAQYRKKFAIVSKLPCIAVQYISENKSNTDIQYILHSRAIRGKFLDYKKYNFGRLKTKAATKSWNWSRLLVVVASVYDFRVFFPLIQIVDKLLYLYSDILFVWLFLAYHIVCSGLSITKLRWIFTDGLETFPESEDSFRDFVLIIVLK